MTGENFETYSSDRVGGHSTAQGADALADNPALRDDWLRWTHCIEQGHGLPAANRELIFLRTAILLECDSMWAWHVAAAHAAGLTNEKIDAVGYWRSADFFDARECAIFAATDEIIRRRLSLSTSFELRRVLSSAEAAEVIVAASHACMFARVTQALDVTSAGDGCDLPDGADEGAPTANPSA